jgi:acetylglutamate kinase
VDGRVVDLGLVGEPVGTGTPALLLDLVHAGYLPVIASVAAAADGTLLNVNADTLAAHVATRLTAARLIVAGATAGVLDDEGRTIPMMDAAAIEALIGSGAASAGMIAKLRACQQAIAGGVEEVVLVDGREPATIAAALARSAAVSLAATRIVSAGIQPRLGA